MGGPRPAPGKGCALLKIEFSARSFYTSQNIAENHEKKPYGRQVCMLTFFHFTEPAKKDTINLVIIHKFNEVLCLKAL